VEGPARLAPDGIHVNGERLRVGNTIIATGASAARPSIPGIDDIDYLTSTTALELQELPRSMLVTGGGYIGCELAQLFARAGVRVTLVCRSRLLPEGEPEISEALVGYLREDGVDVRTGVAYRHIRRTGAGIVLEVGLNGTTEPLEAEVVLAATGRRPNIGGLGLAEVDVALTDNGGIRVDEHLCTSNPAIYAAGDVTGRHQFVYMAAYGAKLAALNALNGDVHRYDPRLMPMITFTDPQVASVGLTEATARGVGYEVKTSLLPLDAVPRALAARDTRGLIKLVADRTNDRLLGAHILAPEGCDSIQTAALAIKHRMTTKELGETIFPYLTTVEGLKLAALSFGKDLKMLSCCAG
jgi:mercuric reductase